MKRIKIAVIFGGRSGEHEVSLVSAASVIKALDPNKYDIIPVGISKTGKWIGGKNALKTLQAGKSKSSHEVTLVQEPNKRGMYVEVAGVSKNKKQFESFDVVFPVLHGPYGEDGTIQGMLELSGIPYVGCGVLASAAAMDKVMSKIIFRSYGLPQVKFLHFTRDEIKKETKAVQKKIEKEIKFPCFVKPANLGSSVGISKVKKRANLAAALDLAAKFDSSVLVEAGIERAREIECAVLGNSKPICSVAGEVVPSGEFYDFNAKYIDGASKIMIPAPLPAKKMRECKDLAIKAFKALHCSGMARVDFLMDRKTGKIYLNEINTIPGFTSISMYPKLWEASGIPYSKLLDHLIDLAMEKHAEKQKNQITFDSGSDWYTL